MIFRDDLDEQQQRSAILEHNRMEFNRRLVHEWSATCLARAEHRYMIRMLFNETVRYRKGHRFFPPMTADEISVLHRSLEWLMSESQERDMYVEALKYLHKFGLFSLNSTRTALPRRT